MFSFLYFLIMKTIKMKKQLIEDNQRWFLSFNQLEVFYFCFGLWNIIQIFVDSASHSSTLGYKYLAAIIFNHLFSFWRLLQHPLAIRGTFSMAEWWNISVWKPEQILWYVFFIVANPQSVWAVPAAVTILICAAVFTADPRRFAWDLFTLYLSLWRKWQPHSHRLPTQQRETSSAHLLSLLGLSPGLLGFRGCLFPSHTTSCVAPASHFLKEQLGFFLRLALRDHTHHIWGCSTAHIPAVPLKLHNKPSLFFFFFNVTFLFFLLIYQGSCSNIIDPQMNRFIVLDLATGYIYLCFQE